MCGTGKSPVLASKLEKIINVLWLNHSCQCVGWITYSCGWISYFWLCLLVFCWWIHQSIELWLTTSWLVGMDTTSWLDVPRLANVNPGMKNMLLKWWNGNVDTLTEKGEDWGYQPRNIFNYSNCINIYV